MNNVKLKRLELTNYRNIEHVVLEFDGNSKIVGENRIGKTNTLEAIVYLLSDRLLNGGNDLTGIKPLKDTKLVVSVSGTFEIENSETGQVKEVVLKKEYGELWSKTRGTQTMEFKGHFTNYFYNGVKQGTLKAYNQLFTEDFGIHQDATVNIDYTRLVIDPFYLGQLGESEDWKILRAFIIKLVGDVSDEDIFNKEPVLLKIKHELERTGGRIDQLKKQLAQEKKGVEESIIGDESRIKFLSETERPTDEELAIAKKGIQEHDDNIIALKSSNGVDSASQIIKGKIQDLQGQLVELIDSQSNIKSPVEIEIDKLQKERSEVLSEQSVLLSSRSNIIASISGKENDKDLKERELKTCNQTRENLIAQLREIDAELRNPVVETKCPTCGRTLEKENVEKAIAKRKEELLRKREFLISAGKGNKTRIDVINEEIKTLNSQNESLESQRNDIDEKLNQITSKLKEFNEKIEDLRTKIGEKKESPEISRLRGEIENLKQELTESQNSFQNGIKTTNEMILKEEEAKKEFQLVIDNYNYWVKQQEELEKAKALMQEHQKTLMDIEQKIELVNKYVYVKLRMLDENVAKVFGNIKFQLIRENINGGFDPVCKVYIYDTVKEVSTDTLWKSGSKSERIATGIAISEKVKEVLNISSLPFLFDEGGEVSIDTFKNRIKTNSQLICVEVKDNIMNPMVRKI